MEKQMTKLEELRAVYDAACTAADAAYKAEPKKTQEENLMTNYIKYEVKVYNNGNKYWSLNGKLHREDGPAVEWSDGTKFWYLNNKLHREDGPAIEWADGDTSWYINDERLTEEEFKKRMVPTVEMTIAEIEKALGKKVKIIK
jgi:hypothetical protein